jgi:hypothetical protein
MLISVQTRSNQLTQQMDFMHEVPTQKLFEADGYLYLQLN